MVRIIENYVDDYKLKKYGKLADELCTSRDFLTGRRASDGIKLEKLMVESDGNFDLYQNLIGETLSKYYKVDFLDFSLIMGKFFGVYNLYCCTYINQDIRKKIINNLDICREETLEYIKKNCRDIYDYLFDKYGLTKKEFVPFITSLFDVQSNCGLYNSPVVREVAYILMGNYLFLEEHNLEHSFMSSAECVEYFKRKNNDSKNYRVI